MLFFLRGILYLTAVVSFCIFCYSIAHRHNQLSSLFAIMSIAVMIYVAGYAFELGSRSLEEIKFWLKLEYFGLSFISTFWFIIAYKSRVKREPAFCVYLILLLIPILTIFFSATNDFHHLHYREVSAIAVGGQLFAKLDKGPWYFVFVIYSNAMMVLSFAAFFIQWRTSKLGTASISFWMMLGSAWVALFETCYLFGLSPYGIDLAPFGFLGAAFFFSVAIVRHDFLQSDQLVKDIVFSGISEGILILDSMDKISDYNKAAGTLFSWLSVDAIGKKLGDFPEGIALDGAASRNKELKIVRDGGTRYFEAKMTKLIDRKKNVGRVFLFKDVTGLHRLLRKLYRLANYDMLTKTFNRHRFFDDAEKEVSRVQRYGGRIGLLMIDLDFFKVVNDRYGHQAGDAVLVAVARTLKDRIRASDILGRYGGEEFIVVLTAIDPEKVLAVAEDMRESIAALRVSYRDESIATTISVGMAVSGEGDRTTTLEKLLMEADLALYRAKREGRNRVCVDALQINQ
ncbi:MAG TPA: diguanylate cyclase [Rectinemataceae bacterium]|nr:diguanylate cyclase [Rectinemataceae bacterium]